MTVFVTGNSHVGALAIGFRLLGNKSADVALFPLGSGAHETTNFSERKGDRVVMRNAEYAEKLRDKTGHDSIGQEHVWVLVMGSHNTRILRGRFWVDAAPSALQLAGKRPVSDALLNAIIDADQQKVRDFLANLKSVGARFVVAACPPTRRDRFCDEVGIPVDVLRYVNQKALGSFFDWVTEQDIHLVRPPQNTMDSDGFLHPHFTKFTTDSGEPDPHHANADYGKLMMADVLQTVESAYPGALRDQRKTA